MGLMAKPHREECLETLEGGLLSTNSLDSRKRKFINKLKPIGIPKKIMLNEFNLVEFMLCIKFILISIR